MRAAELQEKPVRRQNGERLGKVDEIHVTAEGHVTAITCGASGLLQRFMRSRRGHRIPWTDVLSVAAKEIVVRGGSR